MTLDLTGHTIAVLGGDGREVEIARCALASGADVRTYGLPHPAEGAENCQRQEEAVAGADAIICPIPLASEDGSLFAPNAAEPIFLDVELLRKAKPRALLITGRATPAMHSAANMLGMKVVEYEGDEELMLLRAPAIAEGAIAAAIAHTDVTLHRNPCLVVGFGNVGPSIARTLLGLGARVTVLARSPLQRARAIEMGCDAQHTADLAKVAPQMAVLFNTVPVRLFTEKVLGAIQGGVVIDISAPPGGVDRKAAERLRVRTVWARGLGGRAPVTVGRSQWAGIAQHLARVWQRAIELEVGSNGI